MRKPVVPAPDDSTVILETVIRVRPRARRRLVWQIGVRPLTVTGEALVITVILGTKVPLTLIPIDDHENGPLPIDPAPVTWTVSDTTLGSIQPFDPPSQLQAYFVPSGRVGAVQVSAEADGDPGPGVQVIRTDTPLDILIEAGNPTKLLVVADAPVPL